MKRIYTILIVFSVLALFSCSTAIYKLESNESGLIFYVEEINKPINKPSVNLHIEGMDKPLRLKLKAPAATVIIPPADILHISDWTAADGVTISGTESFDIEAPAGRISLVPYKIKIIGKKQLVVEHLTALDLEFAKSRFAKNPKLAGLDINYPDSAPE